MVARVRSWWQQIKKHRIRLIAIIVASALVSLLLVVEVRLYGTGFAGKTLFDWLNLLGVVAIPIIGAIIPIVFSKEQDKSLQSNVLQGYFDKISTMQLAQNINLQTATPEQKTAILAQTLNTFPRLSPKNKGVALQFVYDAGLINKNTPVVNVQYRDFVYGSEVSQIPRTINLQNADLKEANLIQADLSGFELSRANLSRANLIEANLSKANLSGAILSNANLLQATLSGANINSADLSNANLEGANLTGANLRRAELSSSILDGADLTNTNLVGAFVTLEQLAKAKSLKGATMPDGSIHP